ncbi:unnamed protein product [Caenorhabditis nigoni]
MTKNQQDSYTLKCLQSKSGHELLRIQRSLEESGYSTFGGVVRSEPLFTEVHPSEYMNTPNQIPMLTGCNKHEMDFLPEDMPIAHMFGYENPEECEQKYRYDLKHGKYDRENHTDKTIAMLVPTKIRVNKLLEKNISTYFYQLRYPKHSYHTDDLYYAMGVHPFEMDENEIHLKEVYQQMIINFVKFGTPGNGFELTDMKTSSYLEINWNETTGLRPHMSTDFEKKMMDYWLGEMVAFDKMISEQKRKTPDFKFSGIYLNPNIADQSSSPMFFVIFVISVACLGYFLYKECYTGDQKRVYIRIDGRDYNTVKQSEMMVY